MVTPTPEKLDMDKLMSLARRRGFMFQSSEIYGGLSSCWDYGPFGVELKRNVKAAWWREIVQGRDDVVGLDTSILMHPKVWEASGHVQGFCDPLVDCKACRGRFRADELKSDKCPTCGGELTEARMFNLMFRTFMGPVEDQGNTVYLRPETAQGMFVNFENVLNTSRKRIPFGIAQQGKSFRNEITTSNFIFRTREFEQMELEFFVKPGTDEEWFDYWVKQRTDWYLRLGLKKDNLNLSKHPKEDLAHYAKACTDVTYKFPMGWGELEGIANRSDFDLVQHAKHSGKALDYFDDATKERYVPFIIEPSAGVDRSVLAFLCDAYDEEITEGELRVVLRFHPEIAPMKAAVLPLSRKENLVAAAKEVHAELRKNWVVAYDDTQAIGRRYRRQDEIGTPFCITVDFQSLEDKQVTIRERDSMDQIRVPIKSLPQILAAKLTGEPFLELPYGGQVMKRAGEKI